MLNLLHAEFPTFKFATCLPHKYGVCYISWPSLLPNKNKNLEGKLFQDFRTTKNLQCIGA